MALLDDYLTPEQLARELGKHVRTIHRWQNQRIGPPITKIGNQTLYRRESVEHWLREREQQGPRRSRAA